VHPQVVLFLCATTKKSRVAIFHPDFLKPGHLSFALIVADPAIMEIYYLHLGHKKTAIVFQLGHFCRQQRVPKRIIYQNVPQSESPEINATRK
jgi:hypothetical protein